MNIYKVPFLVALLGLACLAAQELKIEPSALITDWSKLIVPGSFLKTNSLVMVRTNGYAEFIDKDTLLRHAITNGEVCAIVGHQWGPYWGMLAHYPESPMPVLRVCALCKRTEQQAITWHEVTVDQIGNVVPK
jgi:hypothetical protein